MGDATQATPDASANTGGEDSGGGGGNPEVIDLVATTDTFLRAQFPTQIHGNDTYHRCGSGNPGYYTNRAVYRFDVSMLPEACTIVKADLRAYYFDQDYARSPTLAAHRVTSDWTEASATWNSRMNGTPWTTAGGDFEATPLSSVVAMNGQYGWLAWDITALASAWRAGTLPSYGVIVVEPNDLGGASEGRKFFYTTEVSTAANRPHLRVTCQ